MADYVWQVYKITSPCGRAYIGITRTTMIARWKSHVRAAKHTRIPFYDSILEHGEDAFKIDILTECYSEWEARKCERAMIALHDTFYKNGHGFNRSIGGNGNTGGVTEETRAKIGAAHKKRFADNPDSRFDFINRYNAMGRPVSEEGRKRKLEGLRAGHTPEVWERGAAKRRGVKQSETQRKESAENSVKGREIYRQQRWREKNYESALAARRDRSGVVRQRKKRVLTDAGLRKMQEVGRIMGTTPLTPEQHARKWPKGPRSPEHAEKLKANIHKAQASRTPESIERMTVTRRAQMSDPIFRARHDHLVWCDTQYKVALAARIGYPRAIKCKMGAANG